MAVSAADAPPRRPRPLPLLLLLCFAARASSIHVAGFKDFEANCAACDVIAHAAQAQLKENPKKLASDPIARGEAEQEQTHCRAVPHCTDTTPLEPVLR